jgi:hypothetical protein
MTQPQQTAANTANGICAGGIGRGFAAADVNAGRGPGSGSSGVFRRIEEDEDADVVGRVENRRGRKEATTREQT